MSETVEVRNQVRVYVGDPDEAPDGAEVHEYEGEDLPPGNDYYYEVSLDDLAEKIQKRYVYYDGPEGVGYFDTVRKELTVKRVRDDESVVTRDTCDTQETKENAVKKQIFEKADGILEKYKIYISEAETYGEAQEMAPEWADVQVSEQGSFYYEKLPGQGDDDGDEMDKADFPPWCRSCRQNKRMKGSFVCPACHPSKQEDEDEVSLVGEGDEKGDNAVTTGDAGFRNITYGAPHPVDLTSERWSSDYMDLDKKLAKSEMAYEELDDMLHLAHKNVVQWEPAEGDDLSKAPEMWRGEDYVPEFVKELISFVLEQRDVIWDDVEGLPQDAGLRIKDILEDKLTQPQGWSIDSLTEAFEEELRVDENKARDIARQESGAVLNSSREVAYDSTDVDDDFVFYWSGTNDSRTTDLCHDIKQEIEDRGGAVPKDELKSILEKYAKQYDYGTPNRVKDFLPHFKCRHTFVRDVQL